MSVRRLAWAAGPIAVLMAAGAAAAPAVGSAVSFVACPVARDTGPDTDLCFLAEHDRVSYALTNPADFGAPQLRHRVLVEGRVAEGPPVCGATPVDGRVSVLAEIDASCDQVLPFDGSVVGVAGGVFNSGPPEQRARMRDLAKRAEANPALSVQPLMPDPPPAAPAASFAPQRLTIFYPFDSDRGSGPDMLAVSKLAAEAAHAGARVALLSRQGASRLSDGETLRESPGMARRRAEKLAGILTGLGVPPAAVTTEVVELAAAPDGVDDWRDRRIELTATPR